MKEKMYKLFLALIVSLSLSSGSLAQNEILEMLKALSGTGGAQVQELDEKEKEKETEEIKKRILPNYNDIP